MRKADIEVIRGSGNAFTDLRRRDADIEQLKSILAAQIIRLLEKRAITVRRAAEITGIASADFSRIRRAKLDRFTIDRLMTILNRFDQKVDVTVKVRTRTSAQTAAAVR